MITGRFPYDIKTSTLVAALKSSSTSRRSRCSRLQGRIQARPGPPDDHREGAREGPRPPLRDRRRARRGHRAIPREPPDPGAPAEHRVPGPQAGLAPPVRLHDGGRIPRAAHRGRRRPRRPGGQDPPRARPRHAGGGARDGDQPVPAEDPRRRGSMAARITRGHSRRRAEAVREAGAWILQGTADRRGGRARGHRAHVPRPSNLISRRFIGYQRRVEEIANRLRMHFDLRE